MRTTSLARLGALVLQTAVVFACTDAPVAAPSAPRLDVGVAGGGGQVLAPRARPSGYTLTDMARLLAYFTTSGNDVQYYPDTPFQILYADFSTGTNSFVVEPGTVLYVPIFNLTDSPPVLGAYPTGTASAASYVFSQAQVGAHDITITVDGVTTTLGPSYVAGPVLVPGLLDGGGSHIITIGAFLSPLAPGTHTVTISATADGAAILAVAGGPVVFEFTYTVVVR